MPFFFLPHFELTLRSSEILYPAGSETSSPFRFNFICRVPWCPKKTIMTQMRRLLDLLLTLLFALPLLALHSTDTIISTGNPSRSGHEPNHKLDPNVIKSGSFGELWRTKGLGKYNGFTEGTPLIILPLLH